MYFCWGGNVETVHGPLVHSFDVIIESYPNRACRDGVCLRVTGVVEWRKWDSEDVTECGVAFVVFAISVMREDELSRRVDVFLHGRYVWRSVGYWCGEVVESVREDSAEG